MSFVDPLLNENTNIGQNDTQCIQQDWAGIPSNRSICEITKAIVVLALEFEDLY